MSPLAAIRSQIACEGVEHFAHRLELGRHAIDELLRRHPLARRRLLDLQAMLIHAGYEESVAPIETHEPLDRIGRDALVSMADMRRAIGVGDRRGDGEAAHERRPKAKVFERRREFWSRVYTRIVPPRLLPLAAEDQGGGSRRPTRRENSAICTRLLRPRDPLPQPAPARGGGCANAIDSAGMQQAPSVQRPGAVAAISAKSARICSLRSRLSSSVSRSASRMRSQSSPISSTRRDPGSTSRAYVTIQS